MYNTITGKTSSSQEIWISWDTQARCLCSIIDQFRYIKIQSKTIDLSTRLWGITTEFDGVYSPEPRAVVYCLRLNFNISKLVYYHDDWCHRCAMTAGNLCGDMAPLNNMVNTNVFKNQLNSLLTDSLCRGLSERYLIKCVSAYTWF